MKKQIFVSAITILETFLSETFINLTNDNIGYFKNFIKNFPSFKSQKLNVNEIYDYYDRLDILAKKGMMEVIYHNLAKVRSMYISTFEIEFPRIDELSKSIGIRHDLVHRNGKNKKGERITISEDTIESLLIEISEFTKEIITSLRIIH